MRSYISGRSQFVQVGDKQSATVPCEYGIAQGSVLGPLFYTLYVAPIASVIASFGISHVQYADDTQLYIALGGVNSKMNIDNCFQAVQAVQHWFTLNGLSLKPNKFEAIAIGTSARQRTECIAHDVSLGSTSIPVSDCVRSLVVTIDNTLSFDDHVNYGCKAPGAYIRHFV